MAKQPGVSSTVATATITSVVAAIVALNLSQPISDRAAGVIDWLGSDWNWLALGIFLVTAYIGLRLIAVEPETKATRASGMVLLLTVAVGIAFEWGKQLTTVLDAATIRHLVATVPAIYITGIGAATAGVVALVILIADRSE